MKLEIQNLRAGYESDVVLKDLSLQVEAGEFLSLLGPSGCGKSTLMKAVAGIVPATQGKIYLDGRDITDLPIHHRGTVILFQDMRLFPHLSVAENVAFPLKMQGVPKTQRLNRAERLLERVQMAGYGRRKPASLSGGQQQRVALARALAAQPQVLLLDEPFSALDENLRDDMRSLVLELHRELGITVILVTHDREEALSMSHRVAMLFDGRIVQVGTPQQVYLQPATRQVSDYFGNCVYIPGSVSQGQFLSKQISCPTDLPDGQYTLMLRTGALLPEFPGNYPITVQTLRYRGSDTLVTFLGSDGLVWKKTYPQIPPLVPGQQISASLSLNNPVFFRE